MDRRSEFQSRTCSISNRLIHPRDHSSIHLSVVVVDPITGIMTSERETFDISGQVRRRGESDEGINLLCGIRPRQESLDDRYRMMSPSVERLKFLTWNIDGLGDEAKVRTLHVCRLILREKPDIVHLQEVIYPALGFFDAILGDYKCIIAPEEEYFVATLLNKSTVLYQKHEVINFSRTSMGRNMLVTKAYSGGKAFTLVNSHLESMRSSSKVRMVQLQEAFNMCQRFKPEDNVIFAGDMNVREEEVLRIGGIPSCMGDLWIECGKPEDCQYTWDLQENTNKKMPGTVQPRKRFDRVYHRPSDPKSITPVEFQLVGKDLVDLSLFPSDHWGILIDFKIDQRSS